MFSKCTLGIIPKNTYSQAIDVLHDIYTPSQITRIQCGVKSEGSNVVELMSHALSPAISRSLYEESLPVPKPPHL